MGQNITIEQQPRVGLSIPGRRVLKRQLDSSHSAKRDQRDYFKINYKSAEVGYFNLRPRVLVIRFNV